MAAARNVSAAATAPAERAQGQSLEAANAPAPSTPDDSNPEATQTSATPFPATVPEEAIGHPSGGKGIQVELVLAQPAGYAEVWYGVAEGPRITLATDVVARTQSAPEYTAGQRMYGLVEGALMYAVDKAAEGQEMQSYLWGKLARV